MLFNSYAFLFGYLPLVLVGYQVAAYLGRRAVVAWLTIASLAFYAYWRPAYTLLLCASILFNYVAGACLCRRFSNEISSKFILWLAIGANLGTLAYFKYLFPLLNFLSSSSGSYRTWPDVILPLGISFFTFTQIAYLVDLEQGAARQQDLASYGLFVTFFPHLIAGPILHHSEMMPQFQSDRSFRLRIEDLAVGSSLFIMGLFKKVLLADRFAPAADAAFAAPANLHTLDAWAGVLSYALQLYFDFSGYSDMAIGLARMFSIEFPLNFSSPYKSTSVIDFWQRWHMTLTRYIMSYLYNPISVWIYRRRIAQGKKTTRKAMATIGGFLSMIAFPTTVALFLAGVWHGAGLQFLIFGLLHALYLSINHAWRLWRANHSAVHFQAAERNPFGQAFSVLLTFLAVIVAQIFFRAQSFSAACSMLAGMIGLHHHLSQSTNTWHVASSALALLIAGYFIVWAFPNTQQILIRFKPALEMTRFDQQNGSLKIMWRPDAIWAITLGTIFVLSLVKMQDSTTFLYFQF